MEEESVNFLRGYDRLNPEDGETSPNSRQSPSPERRRTVPIIITLGLFAIIIGAIIGVTVVRQPLPRINNSRNLHHRRNKPPKSEQLAWIKAVCAVTQHPESCFVDVSSIYSGTVVDPVMIINLMLQLAVNELANVSSVSETLILKSNDLGTDSALRDCVTLFDDALSQLSRSVESISGDGEKVVLTEGKVADLMTWISAAMTDQQTCVDGLEEMGSTAVDEVKMRVQRSSVYMSNSLAILANMDAILGQFGLHLH